MIRTACGIPTFIPSNTLGFDIETVDYNADEVPASLRFLQALPPPPPPATPTPTTANTSPPPPPPPARKRLPRAQEMPRRSIRTQVVDNVTTLVQDGYGVAGPLSARYRPDFDNGKKVFKNGARGPNDNTCEQRYSMVYVTSLRGLNVNVTSDVANNWKRDLQSLPPPTTNVSNTMMLSFGAESFSAAGRLFVSLLALACTTLLMF